MAVRAGVLGDWDSSFIGLHVTENKVNVSEFTDSSSGLLKKEDIGKARPVVMIERVEVTEFDGQRKLVLHFQGKQKGLALNKTNTQVMALTFGNESDHWLGQMVELWVDPYVTFSGKMVGGIKITPRSQPIAAPPPPPAAAAGPAGAPFNDDIPF